MNECTHVFRAESVSVVVPTYNRGKRLRRTLDCILASEVGSLKFVEVIVVDDGSASPAAHFIGGMLVPDRFSLICIRQDNMGPAAGRNLGFREARGDIVIFVDDDILCPQHLLLEHVAAHQKRPGSVICGRCEMIPPEPTTPLFNFFDSLGNDPAKGASDEFLEVSLVASGQLSVERALFAASGVYRSDLSTPAAEEYELSARLRELGVPILAASRIVAQHDHPVVLKSMCSQVFKHAKGCAEVAAKCPASRQFPPVAHILSANTLQAQQSAGSYIKLIGKRLLGAFYVRWLLLECAGRCERIIPWPWVLQPMYRALLAAYMCAGIQEGIRQFQSLANAPMSMSTAR